MTIENYQKKKTKHTLMDKVQKVINRASQTQFESNKTSQSMIPSSFGRSSVPTKHRGPKGQPKLMPQESSIRIKDGKLLLGLKKPAKQ